MTPHPLDPLAAEELRHAAGILRRDQGVGDRWRFASIELREPLKQTVYDFSAGDPIHREAVVICWNRHDGRVYKATVSLTEDRVVSWEHQPDGQPNMTVDEFHECDEALRRDPRVIEALARRGITDLDRVLIDTWAYGAHLVPEAHRGGRVGWADVWYRSQERSSPYANPVTGLHFVVDLNRMELLEVEDLHRVDEPRTMGEYVPHLVPGLRPREDLRPLEITQPEGVSFTLDGNLLRWQKWSLRVGFNHREGMVLHTVGYDDDGRTRRVAHRLSFAEMVVPYQDGNIECEVRATGIMVTTHFAEGRQPPYGTLVDERTYAPFHQHFLRLEHAARMEGGQRERDQLPRDAGGLQARPGRRLPGDDGPRLAGAPAHAGHRPHAVGDPVPRGGAMALLRVRRAEPRDRGLPAWTAQNRSIDDTDVVLWYVFGIHHMTRPEEWPVMSVDTVSFWLKPVGFFDRNPALDVPPTHPHCHPQETP